jgi:hypothetical protein
MHHCVDALSGVLHITPLGLPMGPQRLPCAPTISHIQKQPYRLLDDKYKTPEMLQIMASPKPLLLEVSKPAHLFQAPWSIMHAMQHNQDQTHMFRSRPKAL